MNYYILGLLATDGCCREYVWKDGVTKTYKISLEMADKQIIEDVAKILNRRIGQREKINENKLRRFWRVSISGDKIYYKYLVEKKKNFFGYFKGLSKKQQNEVIRGMIDGDGSVCINSKGFLRICYGANTKDHLDVVFRYWCRLHEIDFSEYYDKRGKGYYNFQIYCKDRQKFFDLVYRNSNICLIRKLNIFIENGYLTA